MAIGRRRCLRGTVPPERSGFSGRQGNETMTNAQNIAADPSSDPRKQDVTIFKIPIGKLGLLSSVLMGGACGFIVFFVTFFLAIVGMMIYDTATRTSMLNLDISYRYIAAPVGLLAMAISLTYLLTVWIRRKMSGAE
jgi:hypothetical protein